MSDAHETKHLRQEGALPVRTGRSSDRPARHPPAQALPLRPLPAISSDQPNQGQADTAAYKLTRRGKSDFPFYEAAARSSHVRRNRGVSPFTGL